MQYAMGSHLIPILILGVLIGVNNGEVSKRSNRYLAHIFNKYGSHGTINFEVSKIYCIEFSIYCCIVKSQ